VKTLRPSSHPQESDQVITQVAPRSYPADVLKAQPARLDPHGTEKPLTRLVDHRHPGHCFGPSMALRRPEYQGADGKRISLAPVSDNAIVPSEAGECLALFLTPKERALLAKLLVKAALLLPQDGPLARVILKKLPSA
jgi:hypothetical protein